MLRSLIVACLFFSGTSYGEMSPDVVGGLSALKHAKRAKLYFEKALQQDDAALMGSAYTRLGVLYSKVPGWPLAFGDDKKAQNAVPRPGREIADKGRQGEIEALLERLNAS